MVSSTHIIMGWTMHSLSAMPMYLMKGMADVAPT